MISLTLEFFKSQDKTKRVPLIKQLKINFQNSNFILNFTQISIKFPTLSLISIKYCINDLNIKPYYLIALNPSPKIALTKVNTN
jgi:hypothetical protein